MCLFVCFWAYILELHVWYVKYGNYSKRLLYYFIFSLCHCTTTKPFVLIIIFCYIVIVCILTLQIYRLDTLQQFVTVKKKKVNDT